MELNYKAIGKRIKISRIKSDLTQERLAEIVGVSPSHMSNIETGTTRVSLTTIVAIANALYVTVDELLCDSLAAARAPFEKDIADILEDCSEYELRMISDMAKALKESLRKGEYLYKNPRKTNGDF